MRSAATRSEKRAPVVHPASAFVLRDAFHDFTVALEGRGRRLDLDIEFLFYDMGLAPHPPLGTCSATLQQSQFLDRRYTAGSNTVTDELRA
jgi:hypothetical protein